MKQVFLSGKSQIEVLDVPVPGRLKDSILVRNAYSLISTGTESSAVASRKGMLGVYEKVWKSKDRIEQVWELAKKQGIMNTYELVRNKLNDYGMIGYSSAGVIVDVDNPLMPYKKGQYVACMGVGFANHAEYVVVPKNLAVVVPEDVPLEEASFGSVACIALQGIRKLDLSPGERVGVIGLGLIGQICVRLLNAMGYDAYGMDLSRDRANKAAETIGSHKTWALNDLNSVEKIMDVTHGTGLDGVIICAATESSSPINLAFDLLRKRGRVSIVGDVGLNLTRSKMYKKEIEVKMSCSYGPGRYDEDYELNGKDYPVEHARWTERRNLEYIIHLLQEKKVSFKSLISGDYSVDEAASAYSYIKQANPQTFGVVINYGDVGLNTKEPDRLDRMIKSNTISPIMDNVINVGLIGVGGYAKAVHIPNLLQLKEHFNIYGVASRSGATATIAAKKVNAQVATSDYALLLDDPNIHAVIISTRHSSHAKIILDALEAGKHVFVEKPMTTKTEDALKICQVAAEKRLVVRVGFNRRFSPYMLETRRGIGAQGNRILQCRVNIGQLNEDWSNTVDEGGRLLGEGVHFFDLCNWFMGQEPTSISSVVCGRDEITNPNVLTQIKYPDGSVAQVLYTALGNPKAGKEYYEAFGNGRTVIVDDFRKIDGYGMNINKKNCKKGNKGQLDALLEFAHALRGKEWITQGADARAGLISTWMATAAYESARSGKEIFLNT
ncbi:bi-domain-containing oxidoreductase [Cohnella cholangitidis]|uniref:Zinc-binding dehydrogenase n=1 Tax=Cohnella cholangitidis TaxID=2598458 RepID=A0A7G5BXN8_9BACL|nr:bi-domain-containing oxidoreductase [Cohnella cholangitidis]QMV41722.1 zinc-binding dehydrogenase [Cohnella cholangitidis]